MRIIYLVTYSKGFYEGFKRFYKIRRLWDFIAKIPEHELKNTQCMLMDKNKIIYVGQYYNNSKGLRVRFK